jgi:hypothetical protein
MRSHQPMAAAEPEKKAFAILLRGARPEIAARALRAGLAVLLKEPPASKANGSADDDRPRRVARRGKQRKAKARRQPKARQNGIEPPAESAVLTEAEMARIKFLISTHAAAGLGPTLTQAVQNGAVLDAAAVRKVRKFLDGPL